MKRILFFDDEPFISSYLFKNLQENYGWKGNKEIIFVSTIEELLEQINNNDVCYDLFILDIMVPTPSDGLKKLFTQHELDAMNSGMSFGLVIAKKIRQKLCYKNVPVLYLSARTIPPIPDSEKGYTAYMRKPVSPEEISRKMNEILFNH